MWPAFARGIAGILSLSRGHSREKAAANIQAICGERSLTMPVESLPRRHTEMYLLECMYHMRCHRPGRWSPKTELHGSEHLDQALQEGKGAILWVTDFIFYTLMSKVSLSRAGYKLMHLSRPGHPFSESRFGRRLLNPLVVNLELRYLDARVTIDEDSTAKSMRALLRRLRSNGIVTITVGDEARQTRLVPFLDGQMALATGAPKLALASGAPILPVFTLYREDGHFDTHIGPPLTMTRDDPADEAVLQAMRGFAEQFEPYALAEPHLWREWAALIAPATKS